MICKKKGDHHDKKILISISSLVVAIFGVNTVSYANEINSVSEYSNISNTITDFDKLAEKYTKANSPIKLIDIAKAQKDNASQDFLDNAYAYNLVAMKEKGIVQKGGFFLLNYGRYCGPGNSGPGNPVDDLDTACRSHDRCYGKHGHGNKQCDKDFVATLRKILPTVPVGKPGKYWYIKGAIAYFG